MIRSIVFPRVVGKSLSDLQPALDLFRALGFASGNEWHEGSSHGIEMLAPSGGLEFIAATDLPGVDATVEVSDADAAYEIAKKLNPTLSPRTGDEDGAPVGVKIQHEIGDTSYGGRLFEVEVGGLRIAFLTYAKKPGESRGLEGKLDARGKNFALVVSRFNSFITDRLLDGAVQALRQCGTKPENLTIVHVPGAFEIPSAARQLAETGRYHAIVCIGCLLRGDTLHYEVIANEVARGIGQSAQETGVPHALGVLTCDTLQQAIDRAGLKAGNKGFEAGLAAVEMACLRQAMPKKRRASRGEGTAGPSAALRSARDDKSADPSTALRSARDDKGAGPSTALRSARDDNSKSGSAPDGQAGQGAVVGDETADPSAALRFARDDKTGQR
ncbi:MAG: 6,7-dimethyl-8-ribityllumazine synthase [Candidatus Korobacteraceae bacterium]